MKSFFTFILVVTISFGCSVKPVEVAIITIKGSDSMLQLTENLAEEYMKTQSGYFNIRLWRWDFSRC